MVGEFRAYLLRSNVLALALAVVIGTALAAVVASLVTDVVMPPIGLLFGSVSFADLFVDLSEKGYPSLKAAQDAGAPTLNYGLFLNSVVTFVIVAFVVFLVARTFAKDPPKAPTKACPYCAEEILAAAVRCPRCTSQLAGA